MKKRRVTKKMVVFPGLHTINWLFGIKARAVMHLPDLQHCYDHTCSPVPVVVYPKKKRAEPQPGRANIHRTGNQAHFAVHQSNLSWKKLRHIALKRQNSVEISILSLALQEDVFLIHVLLLVYSVWKRQNRPDSPATATAPSPTTGKQPIKGLPLVF